MKIRNVLNTEQSIFGQTGADVKELVPERSLMFYRVLNGLRAEQHQRNLADLALKINDQGRQLAKKADIRELQKYRQLISEFIREIVSNSYAFDKENSYEARRRHKVFATVNKINAKLEELAQEMLLDQADNLAILDKVDDIRGLLLDIML